MTIPQGYKQTELGIIPEDWEVTTIKQIADITTGNKNTQDAEEGGKYPFYVRSQNVERINSYSYDCEGIVTAGDGVGTGKIFHYVRGKFGLHQRAYLIYNFKDFDSQYFYWYFSQYFYDRINQMTAKSSVDSVRKEMIEDMCILRAPIAEQRAIAEALSDVDGLIAALDKKIAKKRLLKQGAMQQLLTGKTRVKI
jgi:type I restriction enzyme S subunit